MLHLPHDVWLHIAQFIPALMLRDLLTVNSTFFDIAMDCRYRQMSFAFLDSRMLRNLVRLKDPAVAKRVRVLHVYPGFLKQVLDCGDPTSKDTRVRRSLRLRLADLANHILEQKKLVKHNQYRLIQAFRTPGDVVKVMLDVFASLPNVTDYHIMWCGLQSVPTSPVPFLAALFHPNLRKLSLEISMENIESLFPLTAAPPIAFCNLEELDLVLRIDHFCLDPPGHNLILINHLAPAITRLQSSLRKLSIQAWEALDLAPLFRAIHFLPYLNHLTLTIPVDAPHLGDPAGLGALLNRQRSTLRSLSLRATQYAGAGLTPDATTLDMWVRTALAPVHLPRLRELDISSSLFPRGTALYCLRKFSSTITALVLTGCYHRYVDVVAIITEFLYRPMDERLATLRLGSVTLTPKLVDLLAEALPQLERLELLVREVVPDVGGLSMDCAPRHCVESQIDDFFCEMEHRTYLHWKLRHMVILLTSFPYRFHYGTYLEQLFAHCVPSIQGFT